MPLKKPGMQGAQTLRTEAYSLYAVKTKDAAQRGRSGFFSGIMAETARRQQVITVRIQTP